ncbi:MAG: 16S rRNA (cytosine(1402)-N(4))-methyltransferase RsmH [Bacteroidales bacterium]
MAYHVPVLLHESIQGLSINPDGTYLDLTFGGGGHSREIIKYLSPKGRLIAFDQDEEAFANTINDDRFLLIRSNFKFFQNFLKYYKIQSVDGILADLGVSSRHLDSPQRGFSFRFNGPLDMRMNQQAILTAEKVINDYDETLLRNVLSLYGELKNARKVASTIVKHRNQGRINSIEKLSGIVEPLFPNQQRNKMMAKLFQALRIEVNGEMDALKKMLLQTEKVLKTNGRLVVISYHSLEDRIVKNFLRTGNFQGEKESDFYGNIISKFEQINRKVIVPTDVEVERNPRARSAKLRVGRKK